MSDLASVRGFEDVWRPVALPRVADRRVTPYLADEAHARLLRIVRKAPEVMVKITGKTRDEGHLQAHLRYISRDGSLPLESRDGGLYSGLKEVAELGRDWASDDLRRRRDASLTTSIVLSMPPGTPMGAVKDAARAFAAETFGGRFDYVFALHTDADHPHVHLTVRSLGEDGERLNPRKADLDLWRQTFARMLRSRDVEAEATTRRARGVVRKRDPIAIHKLRERHDAGRGAAPRVLVDARLEAERIARRELTVDRPWEGAILRRNVAMRRAYLAAVQDIERLGDPDGVAPSLRSFVRSLPKPLTRRDEWIELFRSDPSRSERTDSDEARRRDPRAGDDRNR